MSSNPLISSPALDRKASRMDALRIEDVARDAAVKTADTLVSPLRRAARAAGGSAALARDVRVFDGHLNELVMRDGAHRGDVIVGVGGESPHADDAEELEWGSLEVNPTAWVRHTVAERAHETVDRWSSELTRELDRQIG